MSRITLQNQSLQIFTKNIKWPYNNFFDIFLYYSFVYNETSKRKSMYNAITNNISFVLNSLNS